MQSFTIEGSFFTLQLMNMHKHLYSNNFLNSINKYSHIIVHFGENNLMGKWYSQSHSITLLIEILRKIPLDELT